VPQNCPNSYENYYWKWIFPVNFDRNCISGQLYSAVLGLFIPSLHLWLPYFFFLNCKCKFGLGPLACLRSEFDFWNLWIYFWTFGRTPWTGDRLVASPLPTQNSTAQKRGHTSMPRAGFEPAIPVFELSKDSTCLRPLGHWDRPFWTFLNKRNIYL
jgi:hypothetical protein